MGSPVFACSFATVDELRISAIERSPEEIAQAARQDKGGFSWDRWTLLLDHFDRIEPDSSRADTAWTKAEGGIRGQIQGCYRQTAGRFGSALQLLLHNGLWEHTPRSIAHEITSLFGDTSFNRDPEEAAAMRRIWQVILISSLRRGASRHTR